MITQIQLKTKSTLLEMGYPYNENPDDFFNLLSGKILSLDLTKTITSDDGTIYLSKEYPEYAIYDYLIERVVHTPNSSASGHEYTLGELSKMFGVSPQGIDNLLKRAFEKINKYSVNFNGYAELKNN